MWCWHYTTRKDQVRCITRTPTLHEAICPNFLDAEFKVLCHLLNQPMYWPEDLRHRTIHIIDLLLNNHETVSGTPLSIYDRPYQELS